MTPRSSLAVLDYRLRPCTMCRMVSGKRESLITQMRRDGLVTTTWNESPSGPPRRYYELTGAGHQALELFTSEWDRFTTAVDHLLTQGGTS